jgi:hypothetical protein
LGAAAGLSASDPAAADPNDKTGKAAAKAKDKQSLSEEDAKQLEKLKARDREVRAHEAAHLAASGGLAQGGPSFAYQRGPDGNLYAIGGEVSIDVSPVSGDPEATIRKAETIRRAALAPASPSGPDRAVAASADQMESAARAEQLRERQAQRRVAGAYGAETPAGSSGFHAAA